MPVRRYIAAITAAFVLLLASVHVCGPDWTPDIFVPNYRPDVPRDFFSGRLGVLQEMYYRFNLIAAYRFLSGGRLGASEQITGDPAVAQDE